MISALRIWWQGRSRREQWLLGVMLVLLGGTILWLGVYRPVEAGLAAARARHDEAVALVAATRADAEAFTRLGRASRSAAPANLAAFVTADAVAAGFTAAVVTPAGDRRATVSIPSARPAAAGAWLAGLEAKGIVVERLSARANSDPTLAIDLTLVSGS